MFKQEGDDRVSQHKAVFKPRARLIKILGEHLIRDNTVGVLELIKNSYDADAENVSLLIEDTKDPSTTQIVIRDDGTGMDSEIVEGRWFEPAHGAKDDSKRKLIKSKMGRTPLGEKGVGRFAAQKLGKILELITRPEGQDYEIYMKIDWDQFEDSSKFISEIVVPYEKGEPQKFKGQGNKGTIIRIINSREKWTRNDLVRLQAALMRLRSPGVVTSDFNIDFICPDYPDLQNLDKGDILDRFQYKIECNIDNKGFLNYSFTESAGNGEQEIRKSSCDLWSEVSKSEKEYPVCGPFKVNIYAWMREVQNLKNYGLTREHLLELAGISIFRDGFRILPYGDPGDDWLQLDQRRINVPASRVGNRQVIGLVELDQEKNSNLIDKTNREGLQENKAFFDMKELVLGCITKLEQEMQPSRKKMSSTTKSKKVQLENAIEVMKKEIEILREEAEKNRQKEEGQKDIENLTETKTQSVTSENVITFPKEKFEEFQEKYSAVCNSIQEYAEAEDENRQVFLHLMGIGLSSERFSHEFNRMVTSISQALDNLNKKYGSDLDINKIGMCTDALRNELRLMSVMQYTKGTPKERKTSLSETLNLILMIHKEDLARENIEIVKNVDEDIITRIPSFSVAQILDNFLDNAFYWLATKTQKQGRKIGIFFDKEKNSLLITNNGPGLAANVRSNMFHLPFVTSKPHGRGLGMYICSEILSLYGGNIKVIGNDEDPRVMGIGFIIYFPPKI
ncbi:sensor histidine kinase [Candidatus Woesearchaeota archaeon]|nr:sensor histidine kinase [Candidatus Woesearchaeota archaeon]